jgi:hypothetical protein
MLTIAPPCLATLCMAISSDVGILLPPMQLDPCLMAEDGPIQIRGQHQLVAL